VSKLAIAVSVKGPYDPDQEIPLEDDDERFVAVTLQDNAAILALLED